MEHWHIRQRTVAVVAAWVTYLAVWPFAYHTVGRTAGILILLPLAVGSWLFGLRGGVAGAIVMFPLQIGLFVASGRGWGWEAFGGFPEGLSSFAAAAFVALLLGWAFEANQRLGRLSDAKDRFVAGVSHEMRNPLTGVVGLARTLVEGWDGFADGERRELVETIAGQASDVADIVDDLLVATRIGSGTIPVGSEPTGLQPLAHAVLLQHGAPAVVLGAPALAAADPRRVRQIVRNLVLNAQRYGGSRIRVLTGWGDDAAWLEVRDNGPGVPEGRETSLFVPYAMTSDASPSDSVGLGLPVSAELARLMGGALEYCREGDETVFRLTLPGAEVPAP